MKKTIFSATLMFAVLLTPITASASAVSETKGQPGCGIFNPLCF